MKIIEPKVEILSELDITPESHIARCARVCYGREYKEPNQEADEKMVQGLIKNGHLSMLRHASFYEYSHRVQAVKPWMFSPYVVRIGSDTLDYLSTNGQYIYENGFSLPYSFSPKAFLEECKKTPLLFNLFRLTFCITTQISTSRELNRVSPNNIAERSTRYCTSKEGLEIAMPQRHSALDYQELYEELKKQFFTENNMEKKQPDFNDEPYKTDGEGNELTIRDCLNRRERRKMMRMKKKNRRR